MIIGYFFSEKCGNFAQTSIADEFFFAPSLTLMKKPKRKWLEMWVIN